MKIHLVHNSVLDHQDDFVYRSILDLLKDTVTEETQRGSAPYLAHGNCSETRPLVAGWMN